MYSVISFFTGAGFLDFGFEKAGFRVDMINEFDKDFLEGYRHSRKVMKSPRPRYGHHLGSVEDMSAEESFEETVYLKDTTSAAEYGDDFIGPFQAIAEVVNVVRPKGAYADRLAAIVGDIQSSGRKVGFVGGPPCPDFSIGGKQGGEKGDNGRLTEVYFKLVTTNKPDFFVFENVEGLWKTKRHRAFYDRMKKSAEDAGYVLHDRLINAVEYGVGQSRPRIFLVGIKDGDPSAQFPWEESMMFPRSVLDGQWPTTASFAENSEMPFPAELGIPEELTVEHWFRRNRVYNHPNSDMAFTPISDKFGIVPEGMTDGKSFKRLHRWRYSPTACYGNNEVHLHPYIARRISVAEALALQSMPPEYALPETMALSKCFKTIGNGVPFLAAKGLAESVKKMLDRSASASSEDRDQFEAA